jgi:hypothetical protein
VWHVVVAKIGAKIAKVQCKECGGYHRYRPVAGAKTKAAPARRKAGSKKKFAESSGPMKVEPNMLAPIRGYSIKELYAPGERVDHPKFGLGVVEDTGSPGKMTVFFSGVRRVLAMAKPASTLAPPRAGRLVHTPE